MTISGKSMNLYDLKKVTVARQVGFVFNQVKKLIIKNLSRKRHINICYYLKFQILMYQRQISRIISQNRELVKENFNGMGNPFHFACQKWILEKNS